MIKPGSGLVVAFPGLLKLGVLDPVHTIKKTENKF
jgi:hypothetical protein